MSTLNRVGFVMLFGITIGLLLNLLNDDFVDVSRVVVIIIAVASAGVALYNYGDEGE